MLALATQPFGVLAGISEQLAGVRMKRPNLGWF